MRTEENIVIMNEIIQENPSPSVRKPATEVKISFESERRILKIYLRLKPYKIQASPQLSSTS